MVGFSWTPVKAPYYIPPLTCRFLMGETALPAFRLVYKRVRLPGTPSQSGVRVLNAKRQLASFRYPHQFLQGQTTPSCNKLTMLITPRASDSCSAVLHRLHWFRVKLRSECLTNLDIQGVTPDRDERENLSKRDRASVSSAQVKV